MENRRQTYRHSFESQEALRAELARPGQRAALPCELLDLSLGGMRARLREPIGALRLGDTVVFRVFGLEASSPVELSLSVPSKVVYLAKNGEDWHCAIQFLPLADPRANDNRERTISRFLLAEQRRKRQIENENS